MKTLSIIRLISLLLIVFSSFCIGQSGTWTELKPKNSPSARENFGMSSITDGKVILFGGFDTNGIRLNDTWIFDFNKNDWTLIKCKKTPPKRYKHKLAQIDDKKVLMYGGSDNIVFDDTWLFDLDSMNWIELYPNRNILNTDHTSGRDDYALAYLEEKRVLLYGGMSFAYANSDTWYFDLDSNTWIPYDWSNKNPGGLQGASMCNLKDGSTILFGGWQNEDKDKTWIFDINYTRSKSWTEINPKVKPSTNSNLAIERINKDYILLWGGFPITKNNSQETWLFKIKDTSWTKANISLQPQVRNHHKMSRIYDNKIILFGGYSDPKVNDTWLFSLDPTDVPESNIQSETLISPNPASDYIVINVGVRHALPLVESIEIFNIFGESVSTTPPFGHTFINEGEVLRVDVSNLPAGVYFIKIGDKFEKFVKW